jgi:vacuolar protein sorting-associated protein IST1
LLELLELYCELLIARFGLLDQNAREPDPGVSEGVYAVIYAAPRTELKELHVLRDILMHKYGRDLSAAVMENRDGIVTERVARKLTMATPSTELVDAYLSEIGRAYNVHWAPTRSATIGQDDDTDGGAKTSSKETEGTSDSLPAADTEETTNISSVRQKSPKLPDIPPTEDEGETKSKTAATRKASTPPPKYNAPPEDDFDALTRRFEALKKR